MSKKLLTAAAMTLMLVSGSALAQNSGDSAGVPPVESDMPAMGDFFTDDTMSEVRPAEENEATFMAMPEEDRQAWRTHCDGLDAAMGSETDSTETGSIAEGEQSTTTAAPDASATAMVCDQINTWPAQ